MSRRRPDPTVTPEAAPREADLERRVAALEARLGMPGVARCRCGSEEGVRTTHFSRGPGHMTEVAALCTSCRTSFSPSPRSPSPSAS